MSARDEFGASLAAGAGLVACALAPAPRTMGVERVGVPSGGGGAGCGGGAAGEPPLNGSAPRVDEPARKRPKLEDTAAPVSAPALRKRVLECKLLRLKSLRDRLTEQLSELYFLQAGGNMMDYAAWRKRPPAPQLLAFLEARRPPALAPPPPDPPPAPAPAPAPTPAPAAPTLSAADEVVEKAKQEAYVARRVAELARAGLWAERRLPRVLEPPRAKSHWDYLLEEMAWLAQDFAHERKWKKQAAKKCARAVQKYFQDKALAAQRAEKAQELQLRKIAAFAAREIRTFWTNVEKLVEWKRLRRVERARKAALDEQLRDIVHRTERYSRALAADLPAPPQHQHRQAHSPTPPLSDYGPGGEESADDEDTIAAQERTERAEDTAAELAALRDEAELGLDELVRRYSAAPAADSSTDAGTDSDGDGSASVTSGSSAVSLEALMEVEVEAVEGSGERRVEACATMAAMLQPTGCTLAETAVGTAVPRLLKHALREYQHVGLHWLATMHARRLNGILADEMGLGKTIQTIALLAHLALDHADWGPHLVVAPTSVVLNWEMEFKKWCPAFKILTYYGTIKERKLKRVGWTKANSFHVCITSYKLVVQDHQSFRRKRWRYLILDEAQNIKNFKSQRWQLLLNFQTERRLLLTGTPLQNSLLELWSLMHFLMPAVFASHSHFREWFGDVAAAAEGAARNDALVRRLHEVLRPFLLRRLKADVERQMPRKYEHVLLCRLSKRQRFLYDDFMARAKTKESLASGNLLSVINVLMQLRKVCNHPDLFEARPVVSPLQLPPLQLRVPALCLCAATARAAVAARLGGDLASLEAGGAGAFPAHRARHLAPPRRLVEELGARASPAAAAPRPPPARLRLHLRLVPRALPPAAAAAALLAPHVACSRPAAARHPPTAGAAPAPSRSAGAAAARLEARRRGCLRRLAAANERRCWRLPLYGADLRAAVHAGAPPLPPRDIAQVLEDMHDIIDRFSVCCSGAVASAAQLVVLGGGAGWRGWRRRCAAAERALRPPARAALALLHAPASRQAVAFPHPRLLQYDSGKLQTLARLVRQLRSGGHRALIFTQMTRVLDVLEAFLARLGLPYLRLDGATRVEARQPLVERFNADKRVFAMILSTRSGGVGLNLTGADAVVFYDSDWNPTMDAQAMDRAHRIGQTRDVHVYRLVTAGTVEENILRKAQHKRALSHLAIEDGHFTTSYLRQANIRELFGGEAEVDGCAAVSAEAEAGGGGIGGELESALAACEDEADAAAARAARAEQRRDLAEFDESLPLEEEASPAEDAPADITTEDADADAGELAALMKQLTPIEKYAMRLVEGSADASAAERQAFSDMRRALREPRAPAPRAAAAAAPPEPHTPPTPPEPEPDLTYCREDARAKVWVSGAPGPTMPVWCPPTPPAGDGDVYCERWSRALYRTGVAPDAALPPVPRREQRARDPRRRAAPRHAAAPPSLFERAGPRPRPRPRAPLPASAAPSAAPPPPPCEWAPCEDAALRRALRLQRLPAEPPAALAPNWEWVSELVNEAARAFRSARGARDRHDALADPERARRKHRRPTGAGAGVGRRMEEEAPRPPLARLEAMRDAAERRRAQPKRRLDDAAHHNPKHAALLAEHGVDYEAPPSPMEVATRRAERIAKEKLKAGAVPSTAPQPAPAPAVASQRVVVAAGGADARGRGGAEGGAGGALLYRQQPLVQQRHHLKILHHAPTHQSVGAAGSVAGGEAVAGGAGGAALRTLQLQQLALRRAAAPTPSAGASSPAGAAPRPPTSHVVVAHLAPAPTPSPAAPSHAPAPSHPTHDRNHDDNVQ